MQEKDARAGKDRGLGLVLVMKVLVNMWPGFMTRRSGDFRASLDVAEMRRQFPDMEFVFVESPVAQLLGNARVLFMNALHRSRAVDFRRRVFQPLYYLQFVNYVPQRWIRRINPDVIFAQTQYPSFSDADRYPLAVQQYFSSERHMILAGTLDLLPLEIRAKRWASRHARAFLTYMPSSKERIEKYIPEAEGRVWVAPLYMPYLEPISDGDIVEKQTRGGPVDVLFVGGEARRKGLPQLLEALRLLGPGMAGRLRLTVVSNFRDGEVGDIPAGVEVRRDVTLSGVLELMQQAQVFAFPTRFDSFGRVVVEAMASGCAVVSTAADPQDWMLDYGRSGLTVDPMRPDEIASALTQLVGDETLRVGLGRAACARFREVFYHCVVASQYRRAFEAAMATWPSASAMAWPRT